MKVLCVGEAIADIFVRAVPEVDFSNNTMQVEEIKITSGGDANNNSIDLAKLGNEVTYIGRIGRDHMGDMVLNIFHEYGINTDYTVRSQTADQTRSCILVNEKGNRTFLQYPGTSAELCFEDIDVAALEGIDVLQIGGTFHLPKFDGEGAAKLLKLAQEKGIVTSMDVTSSRSGKWDGIIDPVYPYLDYFLPSIEQAEMIASTSVPEEIADFFLSRGVKHIAIKLGKKGAYYKDQNQEFYIGSYGDFEGLVHVVETTGAGDAFCSGFLTGIGSGMSAMESMTLGTACSAFAIQAVGATAGMKDLETIKTFIKNSPKLKTRESN